MSNKSPPIRARGIDSVDFPVRRSTVRRFVVDPCMAAAGRPPPAAANAGVVWAGCSLGSVPLTMIQYCIHNAATGAPDATLQPQGCVVHTARGGYRYRAARLCSIDAAGSVRLEDVVVSRKCASGARRTGGVVAAAGRGPAAAVHRVPHDEEVVSVVKGSLLRGGSCMLIELPRQWGDTFDALSHDVRKEMFRRYRERRRLLKDAKRERRAEQAKVGAAKKAKRVAAAEILRKGARRTKAAARTKVPPRSR